MNSNPSRVDRRPIVSMWMWWATYHKVFARTGDVHAAGIAASEASGQVWNGSP